MIYLAKFFCSISETPEVLKIIVNRQPNSKFLIVHIIGLAHFLSNHVSVQKSIPKVGCETVHLWSFCSFRNWNQKHLTINLFPKNSALTNFDLNFFLYLLYLTNHRRCYLTDLLTYFLFFARYLYFYMLIFHSTFEIVL